MTSIQTMLIEKNAFFREGLKSLLSESEFHIDEAYPDFDNIESLVCDKQDIEMIIIGSENSSETLQYDISIAKSNFPKSKIVILSSREDSGYITASFVSGANGYLLRDISPQALLGSLNMVMIGEKVCSTEMLNRFIQHASGNERKEEPEALLAYDLSSRETQVLKYLTDGETNKQIARDLDIAEATVKVHIKTVLRKLNLSNRTQAA